MQTILTMPSTLYEEGDEVVIKISSWIDDCRYLYTTVVKETAQRVLVHDYRTNTSKYFSKRNVWPLAYFDTNRQHFYCDELLQRHKQDLPFNNAGEIDLMEIKTEGDFRYV
jgi:hypothetical protein